MVIANELKFSTNVCINKMHLCAEFQRSSLNHSLTQKLPYHQNLHRACRVFTFSPNLKLLSLQYHYINLY